MCALSNNITTPQPGAAAASMPPPSRSIPQKESVVAAVAVAVVVEEKTESERAHTQPWYGRWQGVAQPDGTFYCVRSSKSVDRRF